MGLALEVIDTFVTNPAAALTAVTVFPGDTLAVRSFQSPAAARLLEMWATSATAGIVRVRSPRMHDNVQGIRFRDVAALNRGLFADRAWQRLYAQDVLIVEQSGGAAETDGASLLNFYDDLPGSDARLTMWDAIRDRIVNLVNVEVANGAGAAVGARSASAALNASFDLLIANTDYALLGYEVDVAGLSIGIRGPDTANLRVGGPMVTERIETRDWFVRQSEEYGLPLIPVINSANKGATLIDNAQVVVGVAANVTLVMAQLAP